MSQLLPFIIRALRQVPVALWWVLVALAGAVLSLALEKEVFPNTPSAVPVARGVVLLCGAALLPLGVRWLWRVARLVEHSGWRLLWYVAAAGGTVALLLAVVLAGLLAVVAQL